MAHFKKLILGSVLLLPSVSFAYTPLLTSTSFDGMTADINVTALAIIGAFMIVAAVGLIIRGMTGR